MPALDGMRVLDMTQYEAGTSCTQLLAWLGADVVKIEPPGRGDPGRGVVATAGLPQYFLNYNSNKRSIAINLASAEGRALLLRMAPKFDVFVENYGPGVIEKLDLNYDVMKEVNPSIIYGRLKGFGLSGPYSGFPAYDWVAQAAAGTFSVTGQAGSPRRGRAPPSATPAPAPSSPSPSPPPTCSSSAPARGSSSRSRCRRRSPSSCARWACEPGARRPNRAPATAGGPAPMSTPARAAARTTTCS